MQRLDASRGKNAGIDPTFAPAGITAAFLSRGAALAGGRRPILSDAFWLDSAAGAMLRSHEALAAHHFPRTAGRCIDRIRHDLRARREGRHEDVFGSPAAGRSTCRSAAGADLFGATAVRDGSIFEAARAAAARTSRRLPLRELCNFAEAGRNLHESGPIDHWCVAAACTAARRHGGSAPRWESAGRWSDDVVQLAAALRPRLAHRCGYGEGSFRPHAVQRDFDIPCLPPFGEHAGKGVAGQTSTAQLIPLSCAAGGPHGG